MQAAVYFGKHPGLLWMRPQPEAGPSALLRQRGLTEVNGG